MTFNEIDLARALHRARLVEAEESRRARHAAATRRLQRRAARLTQRAEQAAHRAERATALARLAV